jgi:hypothetical protein
MAPTKNMSPTRGCPRLDQGYLLAPVDMSSEFYVLTSMEFSGTRRGAYARVKLKVDNVTGYYSAPDTVDSCHARESNEGLTTADENLFVLFAYVLISPSSWTG